MQASLKWLLVPPALALVLFLGPLRDFGASTPPTGSPENASIDSGNAKRDPKATRATTPAVPSLPNLSQATSALVGVLLLGGTFVFLLGKLRQGRAPSKGAHISVRQSVRLTPRNSLHAIQWDDRLLLVGECDGKLAVLKETADPQIALDEATVAQRAVEEEDEGAVPRDMIIPRSATKPARTAAVKPPTTPAAAAATKALEEFTALLNRAQREQPIS